MAAALPELDAGIQRQLAVGLFNHVWKLLEKPTRTPAEDDEMAHAAHASRWHWARIGTPKNLERGEWQLARVYSALRRPEPALHHARRCLQLCEQNDIGDFDLAFAHEALARAYSVIGDVTQRDRHLQTAHAIAPQIAEAEEREWLLRNLRAIAGEN